MSCWTYFEGVVWTETPIDEDYFGKVVGVKDFPEFNRTYDEKVLDEIADYNLKVWEEYDKHPEDYLPCGSERSLKYVWQNMKETYTFLGDRNIAYSTKITGSLRNYTKSEELCDWFKSKCKGLKVIQCYVNADSDLNGKYSRGYRSIGLDEKYVFKYML